MQIILQGSTLKPSDCRIFKCMYDTEYKGNIYTDIV